VRVIAIAAVLFVLAVGASWGSAGEASGSATRVGPTGVHHPHPPTLNGGGHGMVSSISCAAPGECAAGGYYSVGGNREAFVVSERHGRWRRAIEVPGTARLNGGNDAEVSSISCAAAGECAAGGFYTDGGSGRLRSFVVSETNGHWGTAVKVRGIKGGDDGAGVNSISCAAAGECVAGGYYSYPNHFGTDTQQAFVVSERHGRWGRAIEVPGIPKRNSGGYAQVSSISCAAAGKCAAGGYYTKRTGDQPAFVASETNGRWGTAVTVRGTGTRNSAVGASVTSISCAAAGECAAGGYYFHSGSQQAFVVGERHGRWGRAIEAPGTAALSTGNAEVNSISCAAPGDCAAGGYVGGADVGNQQAIVISETNGRWQKASEVAHTAALNTGDAEVDSISCAAAGGCAAGGSYTHGRYQQIDQIHPFVVGETKRGWRKAIAVPGTALLQTDVADTTSVSCAAAGECAAGGYVSDSKFGRRPFVVSETNGKWGHATQVHLPVSCVVPSVIGKKIDAARRRLDARGCGLGKITHVHSWQLQGHVAAQHPKPGAVLTAGAAAVALSVSKGPKPPSPGSHVKTRWRATMATLPANAATGENQVVDISSISCASPGNCTAVGSYVGNAGDQEGLLLTETAGHWATGVEAVLPANAASDPQVAFTSLSCASAGNCTTVGTYSDGSGGIYSEGDTLGLLLTETAGHWAAGVEAALPADAYSDPQVVLPSVSCASPGNCTAVGSYDNGYGHPEGLLLTETAGELERGVSYGDPNSGDPYPHAGLNAVSCSPDGSCTAVGYYSYEVPDGRDSYYAGSALLLTKKGGQWHESTEVAWPEDTPSGESAALTSVSCVAAGSCGATGVYGFEIDQSLGPQGALFTEKAGTWQQGVRVRLPKRARPSHTYYSLEMVGISCTSPGNCGALGTFYGYNSRGQVMLMTEKGGKWQRGSAPALPRGTQSSEGAEISCASPGNCTVVGDGHGRTGQHGLLLTEIAGKWARGVSAPRFSGSHDSVSSVSCTAPGTCGAVGVDWTPGGPRYGVLLDSTTGPCVVPKLSGMTLRSARHSIESHNCFVGTVEHVRSQTMARGHVISQTPQAGTHLAPGAKVSLEVGSGP
jgi:hypothetical protein